MTRAPSIRALLFGANAVVIGLPLIAIAGLRMYDAYLLRQTERQLLAESAVVGELFRQAWRKELGVPDDEHRPPGRQSDAYAPIEPVLDIGLRVLPSQPNAMRTAPAGDTPLLRAGAAIEPVLRRAQTFNLSALRVLDAEGCVIATTRSEAGLCLDSLPEVKSALGGRYMAVARARISDEPKPPYADIRRRGDVRVFSALPVFSNGRVIAVVRASRTGLDALSSLWANRRGLLLWLGCLLALSLGVAALSSAAIARPLQRLMRAARAIERGQESQMPARSALMPREVAALSEVLASMTARLRARAAYVAEFASHASHELKTPITAIRGAAELLQHSGADMDAAQRERFLANIVDDAQHMERLVARLLELARVENAAPDASDALDVRAACARVLERYRPAVRLDDAAAPPSIRMPEWQLASVLRNLIDNALRHGEGREVAVTLSDELGRLRIEVKDRGPGVSEAHRSKLFQRFFTTERERGGTGLGLAIVKAIAEGRGGRVALQTSSAGTVFTVWL